MMNSSSPMISDLPLLAFKAILQLDALRRNVEQPSEENYLAQLVSRLKENIDDPPSEQGIRRLAPPDVEVWSKAVEAYSGGPTASDDDMAEKMRDILEALQDRKKIQGNNAKKLLGFCTALHSALLQQDSFMEQSRRPKDPRRF